MTSKKVQPEKIMIGRRQINQKQKNNVDIASVADNTDYTVVIDGINYTYTSGGSATAITITTGLLAAISAASLPLTLTDNSTNFDIESNVAGTGFAITVSANLSLTLNGRGWIGW